jgi:universal stress protein E
VQLVTESQPVLPRKILAAVNLYRPHHHDVGLNDTILEHASQMAACCNASLHVLYVYDWPAIYAAGPSLLGSLPLEGGFQEALGDAHEESFTRLNERYHIPPGHRHFLTGPPLKTINAFARNNAFDLLVIGSLPHRTVERIMGNTAEHLLNHAPCSVSIVKACK